MRSAWLMAFLFACGKGGDGKVANSGDSADSDTTSIDSGQEGPTWRDVAPIFEARCTTCHQDEGIGTFGMKTYAGTIPWADAIQEHVIARTMPPWLVTDDGTCQEFADSQTLSDEEIQTISDWVDAGTPEGADGADLTPAPLRQLDRRDATFQTPVFVPESEGSLYAMTDEYRCFAWENPTDEDVFISGFEVVPGNGAIVRHVLGLPVDPLAANRSGSSTNAQEMVSMEGADGRVGWDCLVGAGGQVVERTIAVTWAPGQGGVAFPEGIGVRLEAGDVMVIQVHYDLSDPQNVGASDSTEVHLKFEDQVDAEALISLPDPFLESIYDFPDNASLPPGEEATSFTWELSMTELLIRARLSDLAGVESVTVHGVAPHMKALGTEMELTFIRDVGADECGAEVLAWDLNWQLVYFYETPVTLTMDDRVKVTCTWDTSDQDDETLPGWSTSDEMCLMAMVLTTESI